MSVRRIEPTEVPEMGNSLYIEPHLSWRERQESGHIAYFLTQLETLHARGLIPPDSYAAIIAEFISRKETIERSGQIEGILRTARALVRQQPQEALALTERARQLDPTRQEAWTLAIDTHARLNQYDEALALCAEAVQRFPALRSRLSELQHEKERQETMRQRMLERQHRERTADDEDERMDVWAYGRKSEIRNPKSEIIPRPHAHTPLRETPDPSSELTMTWSSVVAEFLEEHWQKLLLCLAVLLIVVSSTVGAHHLLGPMLWSPEGKCILALVYTLVFAAFGCALARWGAENAGRVMLLTTLLVVPVNFALAGGSQMLTLTTASRLFVLTLDAAALLFICWMISAAMDRGGSVFFAPAFFVLSAFNAVLTHGISFGWGLAAFVLMAGVFLTAVWRLNTQFEGATKEKHRDFAYFALGLLTYAFLFGALRAGLFVLNLKPALYAVPVMLAAIASVHTAHHLPRFDKDVHRINLLRCGGCVLAFVAFTLALSRPPTPSALFSGNTLATALLGLGLFATSLHLYRQPGYLYCAFAALFVAYFGAGYFIGDVLREIETAASRALGYEEYLPTPFKSLNGIVFNVVLGLLALHFTHRWKDERLTRHCHYIGLPLSLIACAYSCFEPKAATLCLAAYAVLYALAVWLFAQPLITYLACAAFAGAAFFASTLMLNITLGTQALGAVSVGFVFYGVCRALSFREVEAACRAPLVHASLVMSAVALAMAIVSVFSTLHISHAVVMAFFGVALLYVVVGIVHPHIALSYLAVITASIGVMLAAVDANRALRLNFSAAHFAIAASVLSVALCGLGQRFKRRVSLTFSHSPIPLYVAPCFDVSLLWVGGAFLLVIGACLTSPAAFALSAVALLLNALVCLLLTTVWRTAALTYAAVVAFVGASHLTLLTLARTSPNDHGLLTVVLAIALWCAGLFCQRLSGNRQEDIRPYAHIPTSRDRPLFVSSLVLTLLALPFGLTSPMAMLLVAISFLLMVRSFPAAEWLYAAVGSLGCSVYFAYFAGPPNERLVIASVAAAFLLWTLGVIAQRVKPTLCARLQLSLLGYGCCPLKSDLR